MVNTAQQSINFIGKKHISDAQYYFYVFASAGLVYFLCRIFKSFEIAVKTSNCGLSEADCVVLEDQYKNQKIVRINRVKVKQTLGLSRYIKDQHCKILDTPFCRLIYDYKLNKFISPIYYPPNIKSFSDFYQLSLLRSREEENLDIYERRIIYGENNLGIAIPSVIKILKNQLLDPLFIWELVSILVWVYVAYYNYAFVVGGIYLYLFFKDLVGNIRNRNELVKNNVISMIRVFRAGKFIELPETDVLPGDMVYIDRSDNFKCDVIILKGDVISDESFLTGESVPICKGPQCMVYSGTKIIKSTSTSIELNNVSMEKFVKVKNLIKAPSQSSIEGNSNTSKTDDVAIGLVLRTGKKTKRGLLLTNLLIRKPSVNIFMVQSSQITKYLFIGTMTLMIIVFAYLSQYINLLRTCRYAFDLVATFFNPSLCTALELGAQYARDQLFKKQVNTTETERINTAGEVDMVVFDKTGTLTELGVDILNIDTIDTVIESINEITSILHLGISTCHYVLELDNQYSGDILDMKMFLFSKSTIINKNCRRFIDLSPNNECYPVCKEQSIDSNSDSVLYFNSIGSKARGENMVEVMKIHDFDPYLKRMSSVVKCSDEKMYLFCKGAPDSLYKILKSVPEGYKEKVKEYGLQGHRVLTLAYKEITEYGKREVDEQDLVFAGFIVFANKLKEETEGVIRELREANIKPKMCTGDNILTAISVARECGMIDSGMPVLFPVIEDNLKSYHDAEWFCVADENYIFDKIKMQLYMDSDRTTSVDFVVAIEGKEFESFRHTVYHPFILEMGVVFARFNPENKKDLVEDYSNNDYVTMFCGDGANDTGALSAADVGLSLALNEASLAASFNSTKITSVLDLIKEGRSALAMSAAQFKYVLYAQVLAGLQMVALLFFFYFPADMFSLVNDLMSCYVLAYAISSFSASSSIYPEKISINLAKDCLFLSFEVMLIFFVFIITAYLCNDPGIKSNIIISSRSSTVIFFSMMFLLIYRVYLLSDFGPHRTSNFSFFFVISACSIFCAILSALLVIPVNFVMTKFQSVQLKEFDTRIAAACLFICLTITTLSYYLTKPNYKSLRPKSFG